ncbi:hypothetical protein [Methylocaldum sp. GT1BB]|uniref:hypothetical protein n=1 Tax=Methylocaldum sp. GT1BB TaxID=3438963 RepID=UPI003DA199E9
MALFVELLNLFLGKRARDSNGPPGVPILALTVAILSLLLSLLLAEALILRMT